MSDHSPALLTLNDVSKRYGTVQANKGIDLAVRAGSIHAVLGENGAGKSSLMKMIYGVEKPDRNARTSEQTVRRPSVGDRHGIPALLVV
jgi:ABC-type uncharacterized transport system ATPase subunit